jgi:hypothetical protein
MLHCSAVQSSVDQFRSQDGHEAELGSLGIGLSVLDAARMERMTPCRRVRSCSVIICSVESICAGRESMEELDLVLRIPVTTY